MDIRAIKTIMNEDILTEVVEVDKDYYLVRLPLSIIETGNPAMGSYISKWLKFNDSDNEVKLYTRCIAGEAPASSKMAAQYTDITTSFRSQKVAEEAITSDEEPTEEEYKTILGMINLGPNGKVH